MRLTIQFLLAIFLGFVAIGPLARAESITVGGRPAEVLFRTFYDLGVGGCGNGNCGIAVTELHCIQPKTQRRSECEFKDPVGGGEFYIDDRDADRLTSAVRGAGVKAQCTDDACEVQAQRVRCARDNASTDRPLYYCNIDL
jgi:hypothetical protein